MTPDHCAAGRRSPERRLAAAALVLIAVSQLAPASSGAPGPYAVPATVLGIAALLVAARLAVAGCIESRIAAALICATILTATVLAHTVGAPGLAPSPWTIRAALVVAACAAVAASVIGSSSGPSPALWRL